MPTPATIDVNNLTPARGEPVTLTAQLVGLQCGSLDYAWYHVGDDDTARRVGPENDAEKKGMFYKAGSRTHYVEITCAAGDDENTYTSSPVTVTATNEIWPYAVVESDDDDNVAQLGDVVILRANLERREPPLNWRVTWERKFGNGEWRDVGPNSSGRKRLKFDCPGARTYRVSIYIIQLDESVKSEPITVRWAE